MSSKNQSGFDVNKTSEDSKVQVKHANDSGGHWSSIANAHALAKEEANIAVSKIPDSARSSQST